MKRRKFPIHPERFSKHADRIIERCREKGSIMFRIPPMAALECEILLHYYYGSKWRMVWHLFRAALHQSIHSGYNRCLIKICDWMGWTKVYHIPETPEFRAHYQRHGRKCSGSPNCNNMRCIDESIPKWFRWLTRWDKQ